VRRLARERPAELFHHGAERVTVRVPFQEKLRQGQVFRKRDLDVVAVALHQLRPRSGHFHGGRLVGDQDVFVDGRDQGIAQRLQAKHLRGHGVPQAAAVDRFVDVALGVCPLHGIAHRHPQ